MHFCKATSLSLLALIPSIEALTITEPAENTVINPQQPFTIKWTSTSTDPPTLKFSITGAGDFSILQYREIATNVQTTAGSVQVPANTIGTYGQYKIEARDGSSSSVISASPAFYLAQGNDQTISISSNGGAHGDGTVTLPAQSASTPSVNPQISTITGENGTSIVLTGTREPSTTPSRISVAGSNTPSVSPSQTPNAQIRIGGDGSSMLLSMAGLGAGLVALIV